MMHFNKQCIAFGQLSDNAHGQVYHNRWYRPHFIREWPETNILNTVSADLSVRSMITKFPDYNHENYTHNEYMYNSNTCTYKFTLEVLTQSPSSKLGIIGNMSNNINKTFYNSPRPSEYNLDEEYIKINNKNPTNRKIFTYINVNKESLLTVKKILNENKFFKKFNMISHEYKDNNKGINDENILIFFEQQIFYLIENPEIVIDFSFDGYDRAQLYVMYPTNISLDYIINLTQELNDLLNIKQESNKNSINIIVKSGNSLALENVNIKNSLTDETIKTHYNDDFLKFNEMVQDTLLNKKSGLFLLHGIPGTGKTHYLRYLLNNNFNRKMIYVPPDLTNQLCSPDFIAFMMKHPNSILIIEDAETILLKRQKHDGSSVSNILNLTDGIIGDILQCIVVCTFNCGADEIDPAIMRKGRLSGIYKFDKLSADKINTLCAINNIEYKNRELTLGEFYNPEDNFMKSQGKTIGFTSNQ